MSQMTLAAKDSLVPIGTRLRSGRQFLTVGPSEKLHANTAYPLANARVTVLISWSAAEAA